MIRPLIGWICAIWAHSCATQNVWRHIVPYYRRWILFSSIFIWFTLSCSGCASDSFWISELSFGQTSGLCTCGFPPTQHWITFAALRAICGLQYEGLVTLYIIIIKGNQTQWEVWLGYCYTVLNTSKSKQRQYILDRQTFIHRPERRRLLEIVQMCLWCF